MSTRSGPGDGGPDQGLDAVISERRQLINLAYRLLGSLAEAEDHAVNQAPWRDAGLPATAVDARGALEVGRSSMAVHVPLSLVPDEEGADWMVGEQVADDPAITFGADDLSGAQVAQSLGDRGVVQAGRCDQVRDADRPGGADAGQQGEPGGIGEHGIVLRPGADRFGIVERGDGMADLFLIDDPVAGPAAGRRCMTAVCQMTSLIADHPISLDGSKPTG